MPKPKLIYNFAFVSGAKQEFVVENSMLTLGNARSALEMSMRSGGKFRLNVPEQVLINMRNVEYAYITQEYVKVT